MNDAIARLETEVRFLPRGAVDVLAVEDPAKAFLDGDLNTQRATLETLATVPVVSLVPGQQGKLRRRR